jgi:hypothetical protein
MALQHCKADHAPHTVPCRECQKLEWQLSGLRQRLDAAQQLNSELEQRIYAILAEKRYAPT